MDGERDTSRISTHHELSVGTYADVNLVTGVVVASEGLFPVLPEAMEVSMQRKKRNEKAPEGTYRSVDAYTTI